MCRRMDFSLKCAYAHGTSALRTHLINMSEKQIQLTWPCFKILKEKWKGKVRLHSGNTSSISNICWLHCAVQDGSQQLQYLLHVIRAPTCWICQKSKVVMMLDSCKQHLTHGLHQSPLATASGSSFAGFC